MIEYILPTIKDPADYITALSLFKEEEPLSAEEADALLSLYAKYSDKITDKSYAKLCLAVDLLPGRTRENAADFAALELGVDLEALFSAQELLRGQELTVEQAEAVAAQVTGGSASEAARAVLARAALDVMTGAYNFSELQGPVRALAAFLTGLGPETLDKYTVLASEVKLRCRK